MPRLHRTSECHFVFNVRGIDVIPPVSQGVCVCVTLCVCVCTYIAHGFLTLSLSISLRLQGMAGKHRTKNEPIDAWLLMQLGLLKLDDTGAPEPEPPGQSQSSDSHSRQGRGSQGDRPTPQGWTNDAKVDPWAHEFWK